MPRRVKGLLFVDYVRMLRADKDHDWSSHLDQSDLPFLNERIKQDAWYPMETFERMGLAILSEIAHGDLDKVEMWGRLTIDALHEAYPDLFVAGDPRESIMRFQILRQALFDFPVATVAAIRDGSALVEIRYGMSAAAEEAAVHQSIGFFERLLEVSGARDAEVRIERPGWESDQTTRLSIRWTV